MTFPAEVLDLECSLRLGGTWTDVTAYAYQREGTSPALTIGRGHQDEISQVNPSSAAWQMNNRDGRFTRRLPAGPYYGQLGKNTPVRWSVPDANVFLRMEDDDQSLASCAGFAITSNLDVRVDLNLTGYPGVLVSGYAALSLISQYTTSGNDRVWGLGVQGDGTLVLWWSTDGTAANSMSASSTMPAPLGRTCLRATLTMSTGAVAFYTAAAGDADTGPWTQLGTTVTAGATSLFSTTSAPFKIGYSSGLNVDYPGVTGPTGQVFEAEVRNGISGTVVAHPVFSAQTAGSTSFSDAQGNTYSLTGTAELSARNYRWHGETSALPQQWDPSGTDVWVSVTGGGLLRRLSQGTQPPVLSAMRRSLPQLPGLVAYWPAEDAAGSTQISSGLPGGNPLLVGGSPAYASSSTFMCSAPLPVLSGSSWSAQIGPYSPSSTNTGLAFLLQVPSGGDTTLAGVASMTLWSGTATGPPARVDLLYANTSGGSLEMIGYDYSGNTLFTVTGPTGVNGQPLWVAMQLTESAGGGTYVASLSVMEVGATAAQTFSSSAITGTSVPPATGVQVNQYTSNLLTGSAAGQVALINAAFSLPAYAQLLNSYNGEPAGQRFARLVSEYGFQPRIYGYPDTTVIMGPQGVDTLTNLLQEVETADLGLIFEPKQCLGLGYRTQASMLNQAPAVTLDYSQGQLGDGDLIPQDDDQRTRNDWILTRGATTGPQGATLQAALNDGSSMSISPPPTGAGDYQNTQTVNVAADSQLADEGGWMVHLGTNNEQRYPTIPVNLARPQLQPLTQALLYVDEGDYAEIINPPAWLPPFPVKQLIFGAAEKLGGFFEAFEWNAVPETSYETGILDDPVYGRADTDGSTLDANISSSATSMAVDTTNPASPLWTTSAADFPFSVIIGGEEMTISNITGSTSPQTFTISARSVNGVVKAHSAGADVRLYPTPVFAML